MINKKHYPLLKNLMPPVSYQPAGGLLDAHLKAEGRQHDLAFSYVHSALNARNPATAGNWLVLWEKEYGITVDFSMTYQQRVAVVLAKINETGGLSIPYFVNIAKKCGYEIEIKGIQPFRTGGSRCGEPLYIEEVKWVWHVHVKSKAVRVWRFRTGMSTCGEPLSTYSDPVIEAMFQELKPAWTLCVFFYKDE